MFTSNPAHLRDEIAAIAARLIAEDGLDYAGAKRRAAREVFGDGRRAPGDCLPDNDEVEAAVRAHQALFQADSQPRRLLALRRTALDVLHFFAASGLGVAPVVVGAIANGTAGEHSDIHLQVYDDNSKDLEIHLLNAGIDYDADDDANGGEEALRFLWPPRGPSPGARRAAASEREVVHLAVLDPRHRRSAQGVDRLDLRALEALVAEAAEAAEAANPADADAADAEDEGPPA